MDAIYSSETSVDFQQTTRRYISGDRTLDIIHDYNIVTCIARQRTGNHLATEYTHATIELTMLLVVAKQQSAPMKSLARNYVTSFLWVRAVTIAMQRLDKRTLNNKATVFLWVRAKRLS
jgi:hypothetical protein